MPSSAPVLHWPRPRLGVLAHLHPLEVPPDALRESINWLNRFGQFQTRPGIGKIGATTSERPMGFVQYNHENEDNRIVMATVDGWFRLNQTTGLWVDISGTALGGGNTAQCTFRTFPMAGVTWLIGSNGASIPRAWDGSTATYVDVGGSPPTGRAMCVTAKRLLIANGYNIKSSTLGNFNTGWGFELEVNLYDTPGDIVSMRERGNLITAVYKETSIWNGYAQEELVAPIRFELAVANIPGPVSALAVTTIEDGSHVYLASNGALIRYDGVNAESLGEHIQAYINNTIDINQIERAWLTYDAFYNELWAVYTAKGTEDINHGVVISFPELNLEPVRWHPSDTFPNRAMSAGLRTNIVSAVTIGELVGTIGEQEVDIGDYTMAIGRFLLGEASGQAYEIVGDDDDGDSIQHYFATGLENGGDPRSFKTIHEVDVQIRPTDSAQSIEVQIAHSDFGEDPKLTDGKTINLQNTARKRIQHRITARNFGLRISGEASEVLDYTMASIAVSKRGNR